MPPKKKCRLRKKKPLALPSHSRQCEGNRAVLPFFHVGRDQAWIAVERGRAKLVVERGPGGSPQSGGAAAHHFFLVGRGVQTRSGSSRPQPACPAILALLLEAATLLDSGASWAESRD
jgi:hypothetical protein